MRAATVINENFYPLTSVVSKKLRQAGLTAAEWRIWSYLTEIDSWGDNYKKCNTLALLDECEVSKATFYRAVAKFQKLEMFDFQDDGFSIRNLYGVSSLKNEKTVSKMRQDSQICESSLKNEKTVSKVRQDSQICENQSLEPLQNKDSDSPQTIQTYSDFIRSLSEGERESFLEFGLKLAAKLPKPPILPLKWIETQFEDIYFQWRKTQEQNKNDFQNQKYNFAAYSEPQHQMWYSHLQTVVRWTVESGDRARLDVFLRDDFYSSWVNWAKTARIDVREFLASNPIPLSLEGCYV